MTHITIERAQIEQWLEALRDIDALHHPVEPESVDAMKPCFGFSVLLELIILMILRNMLGNARLLNSHFQESQAMIDT